MNIMLKAIPFFVVVLAVVFTFAFPTPKDFLRIEEILPAESVEGLAGTESAPTMKMLANNTTIAPYISRIEQTGCLDQLALLPDDMIKQCSALVAEAVIEIVDYELTNADDQTTESGLLVERLRLAAANVCRARWVSQSSLTFDNNDPVCAVATISIASIE